MCVSVSICVCEYVCVKRVRERVREHRERERERDSYLYYHPQQTNIMLISLSDNPLTAFDTMKALALLLVTLE